MLGVVEEELGALEIPARERAGAFADVGLLIIADAHGEQFHDLAREVLVRRAFDVHAGVEIGQHGRVLRHADQQLAEIAEPLGLEQLQLLQHLAVIAHLVFAGGEVPMPEQRHLFFEWAVRRQHPVRPPVGDALRLELAGAQPVEEAVDHRLQAAVACRLHLDAQRLAFLLGELGRGGTARRERIETFIEHTRLVERRQMRIRDVLRLDQIADQRNGIARRQVQDALRRFAEPGAADQMRRARLVPVGLGDRVRSPSHSGAPAQVPAACAEVVSSRAAKQPARRRRVMKSSGRLPKRLSPPSLVKSLGSKCRAARSASKPAFRWLRSRGSQ